MASAIPYYLNNNNNKANVCISELLESGLLGEGILPVIRDALERHLENDAVVVPQRARVYAQVLEGRDCISCFRGPAVVAADGILRLCTSGDSRDVLLGTTTARRNGGGGGPETTSAAGGMGGGILVPIHAEALLRGTTHTHNDNKRFHLGTAPCDDDDEHDNHPPA